MMYKQKIKKYNITERVEVKIYSFVKGSKMKIGIDLGGSHIAIGVVEKDGRIIEKNEKRIKGEEKKKVKETIEQYIEENVENLSKKYEITEIGIAIPGTLKNNVVVKSVNLGLKNYEIVNILKEKIDIPIKIRNDAKCAALAESEYGCLKKYKRSVFLTLGTGIGGAVLINGKLLDTGELPGCEFGHMVIKENGILCECGKKGCFEKYASMKSFKTKLRKTLGVTDRVSGKELFEILRSNKKENEDYTEIEKVVEEFIEDLSIGISNLIDIFEPEAIGIGGSFVFFEEVFLERLEQKLLEKNMLFNPRKEIILKTALLKNDAGIIGATL